MSNKIKIVDTQINEKNESSNIPSPSSPKRSFWKILGLILISLIFGGVGGVLGQKIILPLIEQKYLNHQEKVVISEKTEKINVEENSATIDAVKKVLPSVVSIVSSKNTTNFWGDISVQKTGGTGFILTSDGLIITNKHVASDKNTKYTILTYDGKNLEGYVQAVDPVNDIAVLKVKANNLPVVEIGDSSSLVVGQRVIAIGNALGEYHNTVTAGIISGIGRAILAGDETGESERIEGAIQTDAAINPGNSGGPLINLKGQVVGINTAIDKSGQTIGFAIPINLIKPLDNFIKNIKEKGKIVRPMIGVRYVNLTKEIAALNSLPVSEGALIYRDEEKGMPAVVPGSPADKAGLEEGDIITAVNDQKIDQEHSLSYIIQKFQPGEEVELTILRDKKEMKIKLKLAEMEG